MGVQQYGTELDRLLSKVYRETGHDYREYRAGTVTRRLEHRLHVTGALNYLDYINHLDRHPEEYHNLANALSINTSVFFRNPNTFEQLNRLILPELVASKRDQVNPTLNFWSAACARGEEPYSIAIQISEFLAGENHHFESTVYATDINQTALEQAMAGIYPLQEIEGLEADIRSRYFRRHDQAYTVRDSLRQMLRFSHFDLTSHEEMPFQELDAVFCCNVLIYMQAQLQERVLTRIYHSLATHGYLILGEVETPPRELRNRLECLDYKARIYRKSEVF
ncbi:MAG: protein-glutamate O-methyltransferase CheR [Dehalococcoidales bacterium]|jgi:chemotaxis methyl-accepting protein methylase